LWFVLAQPVHLVLGHAELKNSLANFRCPARRARSNLTQSTRHRSRVFELRHVCCQKEKCGREEKRRRRGAQMSSQRVAAPGIRLKKIGGGALCKLARVELAPAGAFLWTVEDGEQTAPSPASFVRRCEGKNPCRPAHPSCAGRVCGLLRAAPRGAGGPWGAGFPPSQQDVGRGATTPATVPARGPACTQGGQKRPGSKQNTIFSDSVFSKRNSPFQYFPRPLQSRPTPPTSPANAGAGRAGTPAAIATCALEAPLPSFPDFRRGSTLSL